MVPSSEQQPKLRAPQQYKKLAILCTEQPTAALTDSSSMKDTENFNKFCSLHDWNEESDDNEQIIPCIISATVVKTKDPVGITISSSDRCTAVISSISSLSPFHTNNYSHHMNMQPIRVGDEILTINGHRVKDARRAADMIRATEEGALNIMVSTVYGAGSFDKTVRRRMDGTAYHMIRLSTFVESEGMASSISFRGIELEVKDESTSLVTIKHIQPSSVFAKSGLKSGDILLTVDGIPVRNVTEAIHALKNHGDNDIHRVVVLLVYSLWEMRSRVIRDELTMSSYNWNVSLSCDDDIADGIEIKKECITLTVSENTTEAVFELVFDHNGICSCPQLLATLNSLPQQELDDEERGSRNKARMTPVCRHVKQVVDAINDHLFAHVGLMTSALDDCLSALPTKDEVKKIFNIPPLTQNAQPGPSSDKTIPEQAVVCIPQDQSISSHGERQEDKFKPTKRRSLTKEPPTPSAMVILVPPRRRFVPPAISDESSESSSSSSEEAPRRKKDHQARSNKKKVDHVLKNTRTHTKNSNKVPKPNINASYDPLLGIRRGQIRAYYKVSPEVIGIGSFGEVRYCTHRTTRKVFAVKSIPQDIAAKNTTLLRNEVSILQNVKHKNVVHLIDLIQDDRFIHIVMEKCRGDLFDNIMKDGVTFDERMVSQIMGNILEAVDYLHAKNIVHRDLKAEHIMMKTTGSKTTVKIIDFGLAVVHNPGDPPLTAFAGSACTVAPEVIQRQYGKEIDLWSIGVITYFLLTHMMPFNGQSNDETFKKIQSGVVYYPKWTVKGLSEDAKDFIERLLVVNPKKRLTARQALSHKWIRNFHLSASQTDKQLALVIYQCSKGRKVTSSRNYPTNNEQGVPKVSSASRALVMYDEKQRQKPARRLAPQQYNHCRSGESRHIDSHQSSKHQYDDPLYDNSRLRKYGKQEHIKNGTKIRQSYEAHDQHRRN